MTFSARLLAMAALALLLYGCEAGSRPFAPESKATLLKSNLQASPRVGLYVDDIDGLDSEAETLRFRNILAEALQRHDFTASPQFAHNGAPRLTGQLVWAASGDDVTRVAGVWRITAADGSELLDTSHISDIPLPLSRARDGSALPQIAADVATAIDLGLNQRESDGVRRLAVAPVSVGTINGLPKHDRRALNRALVRALSAAGIPVTAIPADNGYVLLGSMDLQPRARDSYRLDIVWQLIRPDGQEIGRIDQSNVLPAQRILHQWSGISADIADGVVSGVVDLQQQVKAEIR